MPVNQKRIDKLNAQVNTGKTLQAKMRATLAEARVVFGPMTKTAFLEMKIASSEVYWKEALNKHLNREDEKLAKRAKKHEREAKQYEELKAKLAKLEEKRAKDNAKMEELKAKLA